MMENKAQQKRRTQLSFIIREPLEKLNRSGVNCVLYDDHSNSTGGSPGSAGRLFTAGRDSIIRVYNNLTSASASTNIDNYYQMSLSHHTDWVNDIALCKSTKTLFSASSDTTIKLWNASKGTLLNTLTLHKDYVKCLSYAKDKQMLASAGFDKNIYIWDVPTGVALNQADTRVINENKYSIYSLAMISQGTLLASGSPENCVRLWDPRTCSKTMKLKGHTHNIRAILLNKDGTQCLSASSDHTIRLWSVAQQRCISTIEVHADGVWALLANESFTKVYSGGKDCRVYMTDLRNPDESVLVCEEEAPVLSLDFGHEQESLWVGTTNSSIKNWGLKPNEGNQTLEIGPSNKISAPSPSSVQQSTTSSSSNSNKPNHHASHHQSAALAVKANAANLLNKSSSSSMSSSFVMPNVLNTQPVLKIKGESSIKQYHILNDKRYIVTKDANENVCVWDVLQAKKLESLGTVNYELAIKQRQRYISIPNWFSVDLKLGVLTITLDESDWSLAWVNFRDMESNHVKQTQNVDLSDAKVNYGCIFLESLFKSCSFIYPTPNPICMTIIPAPVPLAAATNSSNSEEQQPGQAGLLRFNIPEHTPIIFSEVAGRTLHRIEVRDLSRESEQQALSSVMPSWIIDPLVNKSLPKFGRLVFILNPYNSNASKQPANKDRLSSIDLLQVKKLKEHVYQKILKLDENQNSNINANNNNNNNSNEGSNDINQSNGGGLNNVTSSSSSSSTPLGHQQHTSNGTVGSSKSENSSGENGSETTSVACKVIDLYCSDTLLVDLEMNLRTIKNLIWKGNGDLSILYRVK